MNEDVTESHLSNNKDSGNRGDPQNRHESFLRQANRVYDLPSTE